MLVLTRKKGEGILIGDDIEIQVIDIKGGTVRLGLDAPKDKKIYRQEIYRKIQQENREATQWQASSLDALLAAHNSAQKDNAQKEKK